MAPRTTRKGRGQLSSIDLLPDTAEPEIVWVNEELRAGKRLQIDILEEFNSRLADRGIGPVSKSAFNRYSVRKAMQFRQLDETRRISAELAESLGTGGSDHLTIAVSEMVKTAAFRILEGGQVDPKGVMELARATQAAASAAKISAEHRRRLEAETLSMAADAAVEVAREKGLTAETVEAIKARILGVRT